MGDNERLQELHNAYVWEVNAAVGEGRLDLVWELADDYLDQALKLIAGGETTGCERTDCAICHGSPPAPTSPAPTSPAPTSPAPTSPRRRWRRRTHGRTPD